jgi:hypothetical protein
MDKRASFVVSSLGMKVRLLLALPLLGALGCGGAASPPAAPEVAPATPAQEAHSGAPPAASAAAVAEQPRAIGAATAGPTPPADGGAPGRSSVADSPLLDRLSDQDIRRTVESNAALFDNCYTVGAGKSKDFKAVVEVKATVGPTGAVNDTQVIKSTAKNPKVDACVAEAFKRIKFPAIKSAVVIKFPINFAGSEMIQK